MLHLRTFEDNLLETYYTNIREVMEEDLKKDWGNNLYVQK
jgi:hypothetical protein